MTDGANLTSSLLFLTLIARFPASAPDYIDFLESGICTAFLRVAAPIVYNLAEVLFFVHGRFFGLAVHISRQRHFPSGF